MKKEQFIFLEHTADLKFKVSGSTLQEVYENSALAFSDYISSGKKINPKRLKTIEVKGQDQESLFYNFLDELIYLLDAEDFAVSKASILLRGFNLKAELSGDDSKNYELKHVKAATYSEMYIKKTDKGWEAQAVLDV